MSLIPLVVSLSNHERNYSAGLGRKFRLNEVQ